MPTKHLLNRLLICCTTSFFWAGLLVSPGHPAATPESAAAKEVLSTAGVPGGLIVHVGCGDGRLTAALGHAGPYLVHGLDADARAVDQARQHVRRQGLYGKVSVEQWAGNRLPYVDNLVNLLVVEDPRAVPADEVLRVLAPNGVACVRKGDGWSKTVKPRPKEIDEWTHDLHDATGNAVAHDAVVGPPRHMQWVAGPKWSRHHDHMASMSGLVSSGGRVFYIVDEGSTSSIRLPANWWLAARDAFSGVLLWKRPMPSWNTHLWPLKSGPAQLPRRLVAVGNEVYVTLALDAPLVALDAASGRTLRTYEGTKNTEEVICSQGVLFVQVNQAPSKWPDYQQKNTFVWDSTQRANRDWPWDEQPRRIMAIQADTGKTLWQKEAKIAPMTLAADGAHLLFHDGERIVCLDRKQGNLRWNSAPVSRRTPMPVSFGPTLVVYDDVVLFSGGDRSMTSLSLSDGKTLWTTKHPRSGHASPEDLLVVQGLAWSGEIANGADTGIFTGRDLHTGEVKVEFAPDVETYWFHHRCYRAKATEKYLLTSRTGIEVIDVAAKHWMPNHWVRGGCIYGIMPCNGLIYAPPHSCGCYLESKLTGLNALAAESPTRQLPPKPSDDGRLQRGSAYPPLPPGEGPGDGPATPIPNPQSPIPNPSDWPTYRHDAARSGATNAAVPVELKRVWQADLGGKLSSVVVAGGKLFVAAVDAHTVHALDAASGKPAWSYTAGGRVDSPPTIYQGRALFGSADGWVYCLRAADGALIWRFRAAPEDRRVVAYDQLESAWPAHGSVLVQQGAVYCVAGRSMFLDGGLRLVRLDVHSGRKLSETVLDDRDPETGKDLQIHVKGLTMPVALPDILSSDGRNLYMRSQQFDLEGKRLGVAPREIADQEGDDAHLFCQVGLLDDTWFHRSYWEYGKSVGGGYGGWYHTGRYTPSGRILVFDQSTVFGYGRKPEYYANTSVLGYELFAAGKQPSNEAIRRLRAGERQINAQSARKGADSSDWKLRQMFPRESLSATQFKWIDDQPSVQVRAMVLAGSRLFVAGPPDVLDERRAWRLPDNPEVQKQVEQQNAALEGKLGARLWVVSAADGKPVARYQLAALPVFDGLAAAQNRLFLATASGQVLCLGADGTQPLERADHEPLQSISNEPATKPDGWQAPEVRKEGDFQRVRNAAVVESKLGYRLRGEQPKQEGVALKRLATPLKKKAVFKAKMQIVPSDQLINGFLALGDGPKDEQLIKCGFRMRNKTAMIVQGTLQEGKSVSQKLDVNVEETIDLTVTVDLEKQTVVFATKGQTLEAALVRRMAEVTHVGYCVDNATADFSPIDVSGE
jgi:outer membrane protein assembly factor BamB